MRADLGHEEDLLAPAVGERLSHPDLAHALVVLPRVVHEGDAGVDRLVQQRGRIALGADLSEVEASEAEGRHGLTGASEWTTRDLGGGAASGGSHGAENRGYGDTGMRRMGRNIL